MLTNFFQRKKIFSYILLTILVLIVCYFNSSKNIFHPVENIHAASLSLPQIEFSFSIGSWDIHFSKKTSESQKTFPIIDNTKAIPITISMVTNTLPLTTVFSKDDIFSENPKPTIFPVITITSTPTSILTPQNVPISKKASQLSDINNLHKKVNNFRNSYGIFDLQINNFLCNIAEQRLNELAIHGSLDNHDGFGKYFQNQKEFTHMGETIYQSSVPKSDEDIVNDGWANSSGHRAALLDSQYTFGCGKRDNIFAVYILGSK